MDRKMTMGSVNFGPLACKLLVGFGGELVGVMMIRIWEEK
jgi:hypothetical protein